MAKATGAEIWDFWQHGWPEKYYTDESEIEVENDDNVCLLDLNKLYDLNLFGVVVPDRGIGGARSFAYHFNKWKKNKDTVTIVLTVDKAEVEFVTHTLSLLKGVKISK